MMSTVVGAVLGTIVIETSTDERASKAGERLFACQGLSIGSGKFGHQERLHGSTRQHPAKPFDEQRKNRNGSSHILPEAGDMTR